MSTAEYNVTNRAKESNRKRQEILRVASECFAESGYKRSTVEDIAKRARVSKGLVFHFFGSKKVLFDAVIHNALDQWTNLSDLRFQEAEGDVFKEIEFYFLASFDFVEQYPVLSLFSKPKQQGLEEYDREFSKRIKKWRLKMKKSIERGIELGVILESVDPGKMSDIIHELQNALLNKVPTKNGISRYDRKLVRQATELVFRGLKNDNS